MPRENWSAASVRSSWGWAGCAKPGVCMAAMAARGERGAKRWSDGDKGEEGEGGEWGTPFDFVR